MLQNTRLNGDASSDSNRQSSPPNAGMRGTSAAKSNYPTNGSFDNAAANTYRNIDLNDFEYIPTPFNPRRIARCRADNFVILFVLAVTFVASLAALLTPIFMYRSPTSTVYVDSRNVWGIKGEDLQQRYKIYTLFCKNYTVKSDGYLALYIMVLLLTFIGFCLALCPIICARVLFCTYLVHSLLCVSWLFVLIAMILGTKMYTDKLCRGTSLMIVGFRYGPAFAVTATLFSLLSVTGIFLIVRTIRNSR
ncbi:hypothetical protein Q4I30_005323 [Leishmania utingensis]|uniref:Amastin-like protein n=1 Tax=Leishmania utingensis TaxID=653362 RepID=A0AAW3AAP3_9TRYP